jgi:hypothetical protein
MVKTVVYGNSNATDKAITGVENCKEDLRREKDTHLIYIDMVLRPEHVCELSAIADPLEVVVQGGNYINIPKFPKGLCLATSMVTLVMSSIGLGFIPDEIANLCNLERFDISWNLHLEEISGAVGLLPKLNDLRMKGSRPWVMPSTLLRLGNRLDLAEALIEYFVEKHCENIRVFAYEFAEVCFGLQDLGLPALVTLEILDALRPNAVPMHNKWDLITTVKHFRR